jgi:hypothetical protein
MQSVLEDEDHNEDHYQDEQDIDYPLDTSIWIKKGSIPELPNTDQFQSYANIDPKCGFANMSDNKEDIRRSELFQTRDD